MTHADLVERGQREYRQRRVAHVVQRNKRLVVDGLKHESVAARQDRQLTVTQSQPLTPTRGQHDDRNQLELLGVRASQCEGRTFLGGWRRLANVIKNSAASPACGRKI